MIRRAATVGRTDWDQRRIGERFDRGREKYAYDLLGSGVNLAARMEALSEPMHITCNQATYERLRVRGAGRDRGQGLRNAEPVLARRGARFSAPLATARAVSGGQLRVSRATPNALFESVVIEPCSRHRVAEPRAAWPAAAKRGYACSSMTKPRSSIISRASSLR